MSNRLRFPRAARHPALASAVATPKLLPLRFGIFTPEGRLVKVCEVPDPRYRVCRTFNEFRTLDSDNIARPLVDDAACGEAVGQ